MYILYYTNDKNLTFLAYFKIDENCDFNYQLMFFEYHINGFYDFLRDILIA
jgi:hypothetical protein